MSYLLIREEGQFVWVFELHSESFAGVRGLHLTQHLGVSIESNALLKHLLRRKQIPKVDVGDSTLEV